MLSHRSWSRAGAKRPNATQGEMAPAVWKGRGRRSRKELSKTPTMCQVLHTLYYSLLLTIHQCWHFYPHFIDEKTITCLACETQKSELSMYLAAFSDCKFKEKGLPLDPPIADCMSLCMALSAPKP